MLGSLTYYRRLLNEKIFNPLPPNTIHHEPNKLPAIGHALAGLMAGITVSFIAAPVEHIKARLQVQYAVEKSKRLYTGPIDCVQKIVSVSFFPLLPLSSSPQRGTGRKKTQSQPSTEPIQSRVYSTASPPPSSSAASSSSGGVPTTSSPPSSLPTPPSPLPQ